RAATAFANACRNCTPRRQALSSMKAAAQRSQRILRPRGMLAAGTNFRIHFIEEIFMDLQLRSKVVLITGGTKGIGLACARAFLDEGASVAICSRAPANIAAARQVLGDVFGFAADLRDPDRALALVEQTEQALGP